MKTIQFLILATFIALFAGCATPQPPNELINARTAYHRASIGPAEQLVPAELHKAHEALDAAEQSFLKEPDSYKTKDLAYVAQRKSELAETLAAIATEKANKEKADADFEKQQAEIVKKKQQDLSESEKRAAETLAAIAAEKANKEKAEAEKRAADAQAELAKLAKVTEEERGLVIMLSGSVIFRSNESALLPSALAKLDDMAKALLAVNARNLIVEGYTDSRGSDSYNLDLSQRRADAVRDYLVQRGYPADRIRALGKGKSNPIADNDSPEGRANNRRVEIIIQHESPPSKP
jgi:outer membrane protein OmpA-like peptidoglycan-associated protein